MKYLKSPYAPVILQFVLGIAMILFLVFGPMDLFKKKTILAAPKQKDVEARMRPVQNKIEFHQSNANQLKPQIAAIAKKYDSLMVELRLSRQKKDTVRIIEYLDLALGEKEFENAKLEQLVQELDSVNYGLRYLNAAKDTIIAIKDERIHKIKRQRNISLLINAIQTGIIILK